MTKTGRWHSAPWKLRREHLFLMPGDSPLGLRLPLDSLPWVAPEEREQRHAQCLFEPLPPLGDVYGEVTRRYSAAQIDTPPHPEIRAQHPATSVMSMYRTPPCASSRAMAACMCSCRR